MLTRNQIQDLNIMMLGLGAPDERDYQGYNKPDFCLMEGIGYLPELDFAEAYAVLDALDTYKNTQLVEYKDDIEETLDYYKSQFKAQNPTEDIEEAKRTAVSGMKHRKSDYSGRYLNFYGADNSYCVVGFKEYIEDVNIRQFGGSWVKSASTGKTAMKIPMNRMNDFLEYVADKGKYGYRADDKLKEVLANYQATQTPKVNEPLRLIPTGQKNQYGFDLYELNFNNYAFTQKLWTLKGEGVKYVDTTDSTKTVISTTVKMLRKLLEFLVNEGVDVSACNAESIKVVNSNASNNTLIDTTKLDLPFTPYPFQIEDAKAAVAKKRFLLGHDMGCGKTMMSVMVGMSIKGKKIVICPETLRLNWKREILMAKKDADVTVIYSKDQNPTFAEWSIIGYKTAVKFAEQIEKAKISCMFVDEAHKCKAVNNFGKPNSQQAATVMMLSKKIEYVYLLTGTPMPTRNKDLFNELVMLGELDDPSKSKWSFYKYAVQFRDGHKTGWGFDANGSSNTDELHRMLSKYMVRRLKSEVLPNLTKQRIPIIIESKLSKDYKDIEKRLYNPQDGDTYMGLAMTGRRHLSKCKLDSAIEFAENILDEDENESVVLVAEFDETLDSLMEHFGDSACCIRGGMNDTAKQKAIDEFQSGAKRVCCINLIAAGVGITLTKAHNMVICDFDWTPSNMTQVEDRICRTGQTKPCNIYYVIHNQSTLDQIFLEMITDKSANIDRVVDDVENTVDLVSMKKNAREQDFFTRLKKRCQR